jgi:hypothetical protein
MSKLLDTIGNGVISIVTAVFKSRASQAEMKLELEKVKVESEAKVMVAKAEAMIKLAGNAQEHEQLWERILAENQKGSWKDEFVLVLFSIPLVMAFIPGLAPYVSDGFDNLEVAPDWYLQIVMAGAAVSYGLRHLSLPQVFNRRPRVVTKVVKVEALPEITK